MVKVVDKTSRLAHFEPSDPRVNFGHGKVGNGGKVNVSIGMVGNDGTNSEFYSLTSPLRDFAEQRNREKFHTPKNLAMATKGEAGELAAEFQWLTPEDSQSENLPAAARRSRNRRFVSPLFGCAIPA